MTPKAESDDERNEQLSGANETGKLNCTVRVN